MQLSIVCLVAVAVVAMQVACNPLGDSWHNLAPSCGGGELITETHNLGCNTCGLSDCGGCGTISHDDGCGCSSCGGNGAWSGALSGGNGGSGCGPQVSVHQSQPIIIQPHETSFVVPATPVIVQPHIVHNAQQVNVHPRIHAKSQPTCVNVKPALVKVIRQQIQQTCCTEASPCHSAGCTTCSGHGSWH